MKTPPAIAIGAGPLLAGSAALAQSGHMMEGTWGSGWMGGYGGFWLPLLLVVAVVAIVVLVMRRK